MIRTETRVVTETDDAGRLVSFLWETTITVVRPIRYITLALDLGEPIPPERAIVVYRGPR